jgi:tetratricopeptide (TPR) repeat protein
MTEKDNNFYFKFRRRSIPEGGEALTFEEAEASLLKQLKERNGICKDTIWQLSRVYSFMKRHDDALNCIYKLLQLTDDQEENASFFLALGQLTEQKGDYQGAIQYYRGAFCLKPSMSLVWYLVNNNLGFCLNELKRYNEAEPYLLDAIEIDPTRPNAYKNLGLCFMGRGDYIRAAEWFIDAVKADASDPRSLRHLENLVSDHPELFKEIADLPRILMQCRKAVKIAEERQPDLETHVRKLRSQQKGIVEH